IYITVALSLRKCGNTVTACFRIGNHEKVRAAVARLGDKRRIAPALRAVGIIRSDLPRTVSERARIFRLENNRKPTSTTSTTSRTAKTAQNRGFQVDEGVDEVDEVSIARPPARPSKNGHYGAKNADVDDVD